MQYINCIFVPYSLKSFLVLYFKLCKYNYIKENLSIESPPFASHTENKNSWNWQRIRLLPLAWLWHWLTLTLTLRWPWPFKNILWNTSVYVKIRVCSHLTTTTQTFNVVSSTFEMGCMVTNGTFHTWRHEKWQKTHRCRQVRTDPKCMLNISFFAHWPWPNDIGTQIWLR